MRTRLIVAGLFFVFASVSSAQAQTSIDVAKISCDEYVHSKIATPKLIAAWLSGYYNGKRNNTVIDLQNMQENVNKVDHYCEAEANWKVPVMQAIDQVLGTAK
jgi:hypothetical protein